MMTELYLDLDSQASKYMLYSLVQFIVLGEKCN